MNPPAHPDDSALARLAREGSAAAFGTLVHRYHGRVFAFLLTLTRQREDAEDLTQETFLRAWDKFRYFDPERPLAPWLFTLARRQSITALRRSRPLPEVASGGKCLGPRCETRGWLSRQLPAVIWRDYRMTHDSRSLLAIRLRGCLSLSMNGSQRYRLLRRSASQSTTKPGYDERTITNAP